jgi:hypothetical protein
MDRAGDVGRWMNLHQFAAFGRLRQHHSASALPFYERI